MARLEKLVLEASKFHFNEIAAIYATEQNLTSLSYHKLIELSTSISRLLINNGASEEVILCISKPSLLLPCLILGILQAKSAFCFTECKSIQRFIGILHQYINVKFCLIELDILEVIQKQPIKWHQVDKFSSEFGQVILVQVSLEANPGENDYNTPKCSNTVKPIPYAYVIQTSGTTGQPKVVRVPHECIVPNILHLRSLFKVNPSDNIIQLTPLTFDPSVVEIFLALTSGATLVIISEKTKMMPKSLAEILREQKITIMQATPTLIRNFGADLLRKSVLSDDSMLRILAFGGEKCPSTSTVHEWKSKRNSSRFFNLYGITEVSCWATYFEIPSEDLEKNDDQLVPLGKCFPDTEIQLVSDDGSAISEGKGQLYIGGRIRKCIINEEDVAVSSDKIMRASGDFILQTHDGSLYFIGRKDSIIKYNGKKIDLAIIENSVGKLNSVDCCSAVYHEEKKKLCVFIVSKNDSPSNDKITVIEHLQKEKLIIPFAVFLVSFLPRTSHDKVDSKALLKYASDEEMQQKDIEGKSPSTVRQVLFSLWTKYTGISNLGDPINHQLILDGGDSVMAVQLGQEIEYEIGSNCPLLIEKLLNNTMQDVLYYLLMISSTSNTIKIDYNEYRGMKRMSSNESKADNMKLIKKSHVITDSELDNEISITLDDKALCFQCFSRHGCLTRCICSTCSADIALIAENGPVCISFYERWKYNLFKCVDASALIVKFKRNCVTFICSHSGHFAAVDVRSGQKFWEIVLSDRIESSPCVSFCGNYVAVGCYDHNIYCVEIMTGKLHWKVLTDAEVKSSPVADCLRNVLYCGSHDKHLYAVDVNNGIVLWKQKIADGSIFSSPSVSADPYCVIAASLDGILASINPTDGNIVWKYNCSKPIFSSPLILKRGVCVGCVSGDIFFWNHNGHIQWTVNADSPVFSSPFHLFINKETREEKDFIVIGSQSGCVYCVEVTTGLTLWRFHCNSSVYATPFIFTIKNHANNRSKNKEQCFVAIASKTGTVYILEGISGKEHYRHNLPGEVFSSPVVCDNCFIIGCRNNYVYCFDLFHKRLINH